jgi:hypothetical protein
MQQPLQRVTGTKEVFSWAKVKKFNWKKPTGDLLTVSYTSTILSYFFLFSPMPIRSVRISKQN